MKKDKLNPDQDEMPGGARIEDEVRQRGSRTPSRTRHKAKASARSSSGQEDGERSQKMGKRSRAQKPRPTSVIGPA